MTGQPPPLAAPAPDLARISVDHAEHDTTLLLRGRAGAVLLNEVRAPDFGPPLFGRSDLDGRCSVQWDFTLLLRLEGQATHLGAFAK